MVRQVGEEEQGFRTEGVQVAFEHGLGAGQHVAGGHTRREPGEGPACRLLTSAGSAAALDLSLHLIRRDYGPDVANTVARRAVVPAHRDGGQAQFIHAPLPERGATLGKLLEWMRRRLDQPLPLPELAERARMSERTLLRRFEEATGCSPKQWLTRERLNRARELLEASDLPIERIAQACGFGSADTLRHHFRHHLKLSPARYRERFALQA